MGRGFTLIELLVVISIISLLSSVVLASLNTAREKAQDARRQADLQQMQIALELYFDDNGTYPLYTSTTYVGSGKATAGLTDTNFDEDMGPYINAPSDPVFTDETGDYIYIAQTDGSGYAIRAWFEELEDATPAYYCKVGVNILPGWWGAQNVPLCLDVL